MADLIALIEDAEADLRAQSVPFAEAFGTFATLEEAVGRLETLRALQLQVDRNAYLKACIDAVMARHGYTIARSVTMGRDLMGTHRLFGREDATEGLHAFVSDAGDLMLQVAGLPGGIEAVENGEVVTMEAAPGGARTERLLADQHDFCAAYDEIAEDLASYFVESEQIPTACGLGVLVDRDRSVLRAGGYLIQLLPGAPEGIIDRLEKGIMAAGPVTNLLLENDDPESLLRRVMKNFELEILETVPVEYRCYCSRERMAAALVSLGRKQLTELAEDPNGIELTCQFCDSRQRFTPEEIRELLEKASEA